MGKLKDMHEKGKGLDITAYGSRTLTGPYWPIGVIERDISMRMLKERRERVDVNESGTFCRLANTIDGEGRKERYFNRGIRHF